MPDDWLAVGLRLALYLALMILFGVALFGLHALRPTERRSSIARRYAALTGTAAAVGIALSLWSLVEMAKAMTGATEYAELTRHVFGMILTGTAVGVAWAVRMAALAVNLIAAVALRARPTARLAASAALGAVALATLAWAGHGAMDDGARNVLHLAADIAHLLAAGAWVGALAAFVLLASAGQVSSPETASLLGRAANGFADIGTFIVVTLVLTGALNYLLIVGPTVGGLSTAPYGRLLLAKLALFVAMLGLAAVNRYRLSPQLAQAIRAGNHAQAVGALRRSLVMEASLAAAILALVAWLGVLAPPGA